MEGTAADPPPSFWHHMISRRPSYFELIVKIIGVSITFFFVIVAFSGPELPISVAGDIDSSQVSHDSARFLRNGKAVKHHEKQHSVAQHSMKTIKSLGLQPPPFLYGTAWKKERTEDLVYLAVQNGFRGIDTACQPKHYFEPGVGNALERIYAEGKIRREDMFIQTKYTPFSGQDKNNVPYDKDAKLEDQVMQSFRVSLANLKTSYLDSLVLHYPLEEHKETMEVWRAFEHIHSSGGTRFLGISNCYDLPVLEALYSEAKVKPSFLQNRFYRDSGYDRPIRKFCSANGITYQSFWTLTANPHALERCADLG